MQPTGFQPPPMLVVAGALFLLSCVSSGTGNPLESTRLWHRYRQQADMRALAIAGNPEAAWVGGFAAGLASIDEAKRAALAECARSRASRRLQVQCVVYAVGNEIVWGRSDVPETSKGP